ncbi:site-specific integrase [Gammaproteobacteria bacterium]|nr:site-specific integrase [Gammaproteobacteria bacterium]
MTTIDSHKFQQEQINLYHGDVKLFRREGGGVWQVKIWIREHQRYFRKSLRTRDEDLARRLAEDEYIQVKAKRLTGQKIFKMSFHKVIDEWLEEQKKTIGISKTLGRYQAIVSQTNWLKKFIKDPNYKIEDINSSLFMDYYGFRKRKRSNVVNSTLINEKATINAIFNFGIRKGYLSAIFQAEFPPLKKSSNYREALTIDEWRTIYNFMKSKEFLDERDTLKVRHFVRDFTILLANTGLRFGEARRLKWKHCKVVRGKDERKKLCEIQLSETMTKNRKARTVQGMRGDVLERIKSYSNYTKPNDFVFVDNNTGNQLGKDYYYRAWKFMMKNTGLDMGMKEITFYNLRHSYATWRLYAGVNSRALCENLGTGLKYLEEHYGQMQTKVMRDSLTKGIESDIKYLLEE